jgi:putative ABC transport system permease protein
LLREFPNVTNVDVSQTLSQVQNVLTQVIMAVEFLFVFALVAGLLVLLVSVSMTRQTRLRDYAVMRAIGASNRLLNRMQLTELWLMGALAGLQSSILALLLAWSLAHFVFEFEWNPVGWVVIAGTLISAALAWAAGWWGLRGVLQTPAIQTLRQG